MNQYNILVFPCGTEIANEVISSIKNHKYFKLFYASSEKLSYCNFIGNKIYQLPYVSDKSFLSSLNELISKLRIDFIIPAHDDVAYELSKNSKKINSKIIGQSFEVNNIVRFKDKTYDFFKNILPIPKIYNDIPKKNDFPVFVKPKRGQGSLNALSLKNLDEFESFFKTHSRDDFVVMELLTGKEFTIDCFSHNEELLYFGARTRDKTMKGITVVSSFVNEDSLNKEFKKYANTISKELKMHGVWFFQMKYDKNNKLKLLEIGPRVAGSMILNRMRGVNFIELAIYQALGMDIKVNVNPVYDLRMGRALHSIFKTDIKYNNLYIDFDDTLLLDEKHLNIDLMKLIFKAKNEDKKIYLITKNKKNNLTKILHKFGIMHIFDEIIHLYENQKKIDFMKKNSVLIDDSFKERTEALDAGIYSFDVNSINVLL